MPHLSNIWKSSTKWNTYQTQNTWPPMDEVCCWPFLFTRSLLFVNCRLLFKDYCCRKFTKLSIWRCNQFGIPKELTTDNGPEYSSHKFCSFSKTWEHKTIILHYHQSYGLAERSIQTVKQTLNKAKRNSEDHFLTMLSLNLQPD